VKSRVGKYLWRGALVIIVVGALVALFAMEGPARLEYTTAGSGATQATVDATYIMSPVRDTVSIGRQASVVPAGVIIDVPVGAVLDREPPGGGMTSSEWVLSAEETSPTPVLLNGSEVADRSTLEDGDVMTVGGQNVTFYDGRHGIAGALDWWEASKITHLFMSPAVIAEAFPFVLAALRVSLLCVFVAFALAVPGGLVLAFMKMSKAKWARWPATLYVDFVRGTPMFLQILIVFFGLPLLPPYQALISAFPILNAAGPFGQTWSLYLRAWVVLSFNSAAYMAEIFRAGIQSIHKGQMEAARSLGMSTPAAMAYVIIPQTVRRILPTMMSEFILLYKDTSLFAAVGLGEMVMRAREVAASEANVSPYVLSALFYLVITVPLGRFVQRLENKLAEAEGGGAVRPDVGISTEATAPPSARLPEAGGSR